MELNYKMYNPFKSDPKPPYNLEHLTWMNTTFAGIPIQQTWSALFMLGKFIEKENINFIVELGTGNGALYKFFRNYCYTISYNLPDDIFSDCVLLHIENQVNIHGKSMVFCDDGEDRLRQLKLYSDLLKLGDFILIHDYGRPDGISLSDVTPILQGKGLIVYRQQEFDDLETFILCLRKSIK